MALVTSFVVSDVYLAAVFNPKFPHDYIMNCKGDLSPCIVVASLPKNKMTNTVHFDLQIAPTEFGGY